LSKQIAQTVGDKRIAWLFAIVAAFAVLATLATQWQKSNAIADGTIVATVTQTSAAPVTVVAGTDFTFQFTGNVTAQVNSVLMDFDYPSGMTFKSGPTGPSVATLGITCTDNSPSVGII